MNAHIKRRLARLALLHEHDLKLVQKEIHLLTEASCASDTQLESSCRHDNIINTVHDALRRLTPQGYDKAVNH